jgi:hypothetical protein
MPVIPTLPTFGRQRQEDCEFKGTLGTSLGSIVRLSLKKKKKKKKEKTGLVE